MLNRGILSCAVAAFVSVNIDMLQPLLTAQMCRPLQTLNGSRRHVCHAVGGMKTRNMPRTVAAQILVDPPCYRAYVLILVVIARNDMVRVST